jgi:hypothetical protein
MSLERVEWKEVRQNKLHTDVVRALAKLAGAIVNEGLIEPPPHLLMNALV